MSVSQHVLSQKSSCIQLLFLRHLTFHKVVQRHTWGVVGSLVIVLLQIFSRFWQWNNFENRLIFSRVKAYKIGANFWATLYMRHRCDFCRLCWTTTTTELPSSVYRQRLQWRNCDTVDLLTASVFIGERCALSWHVDYMIISRDRFREVNGHRACYLCIKHSFSSWF